MTVDHMVVEPHKRGRGRPRKRPVCLPSPELQSGVVQPDKRKRRRPRLSKRDGVFQGSYAGMKTMAFHIILFQVWKSMENSVWENMYVSSRDVPIHFFPIRFRYHNFCVSRYRYQIPIPENNIYNTMKKISYMKLTNRE